MVAGQVLGIPKLLVGRAYLDMGLTVDVRAMPTFPEVGNKLFIAGKVKFYCSSHVASKSEFALSVFHQQTCFLMQNGVEFNFQSNGIIFTTRPRDFLVVGWGIDIIVEL